MDLLAFRLKVFNESLTLRKEQEKQQQAAREAKESNTAEENNEEDGRSVVESRNDGEMSECVLLLLQQVCQSRSRECVGLHYGNAGGIAMIPGTFSTELLNCILFNFLFKFYLFHSRRTE